MYMRKLLSANHRPPSLISSNGIPSAFDSEAYPARGECGVHPTEICNCASIALSSFLYCSMLASNNLAPGRVLLRTALSSSIRGPCCRQRKITTWALLALVPVRSPKQMDK